MNPQAKDRHTVCPGPVWPPDPPEAPCDQASEDRVELPAPGLGSWAEGTNCSGLGASATEAEGRDKAAKPPSWVPSAPADTKDPRRGHSVTRVEKARCTSSCASGCPPQK